MTRNLIVLLIGLGTINGLYAQSATGGVNGIVTDPARAFVPGAAVTLKNVGTNIETSVNTNSSGFFTFLNVQPGRYTLTIKTAGFKAAQIPEFPVGVNQTVTQDVGLSIGQVNETVMVEGQAELIQQSSAELGTVISQQAVQNLPLNGRNFTQLLTLTPGATPVTTSQATIGNNDGNTVALPQSGFSNPSIHGQWNRSSVYFLDGIINTDFRTTTYTILPEVDLIQEFKVQSHNDKAEYGGVAGGIINVVSKSGTNELHGSAFEFVRNDFFNARDTFAEAKRNGPFPFRQNQYGATVSGPIVKNKTFFSGGYNGWRYTKPVGTLIRVPTTDEISGDFSKSIIARDIYDPATNPRIPFSGNIVPTSRISPMVQGFIKTYYAQPNYTDPVFNGIVSEPQVNNDYGWQVKVDHQINPNNSVWFRYSAMNATQVTPSTNLQGNSFVMNAKNYGGGLIHIFTPTLILDLRGGVATRPFTITAYHDVSLDAAAKLGFAGLDQFNGATISLTTPWGGAGVGNSQPRGNPVWSLSPNLSWIRGNHSLKTGFQYIEVSRITQSGGVSYSFADEATASPSLVGKSGASLASALLGLPASYSGTRFDASSTDFDIPTWGTYIQDEWKVSPRLTVTAGLRFDHVNRVRLNKGMNNGPNLATGNWEIGGGVLPPLCSQAGIAPCIPGTGLQSVAGGDHIVVASDPQRWRKARWNEFGPRFSIAWRISEKTVLRTGYGLLFDALPAQSQTYNNTLNQWPYSSGFNNTANRFTDPITKIETLQGVFPKPLPSATPWTSATYFSAPEREDARSHQWNLEIQRQLSSTTMVSVAYVGSTNRKVDVNGLANVARFAGTGTAAEVTARKPYPWMGTFYYDNSIGSSNYNALEAKFERRFSGGFHSLVSYTWSKAMDTGSSGWYSAENGPGGSSAFQNYYDLNGSRSVSSYDIPQFLSISSSYELPFGHGKKMLSSGPLAWALGNWETNLIAQLRSGQPYNLTVTGDVANVGNTSTRNYARPNLVGNPYLSQQTDLTWFDPAAFAIPSFSYGNFGRNVLRSSSVKTIDFSVFKKFALGAESSRHLDLRAEAFNIFNIANYAAPSGVTVGIAGAGRVTTLATQPRTLQLGLHLEF